MKKDDLKEEIQMQIGAIFIKALTITAIAILLFMLGKTYGQWHPEPLACIEYVRTAILTK